MTSKERARLRALANELEPIVHIGKDGITENILKQADDALLARELVKLSVQKSCDIPVKEVCAALEKELNAEGVQVIGRKFTLYRKRSEQD